MSNNISHKYYKQKPNKEYLTNKYEQFTMLDNYRPVPPGPDPPGPTPPDPPVPPTPGSFTPWLANPGNSIIASAYWIDIDFSGYNRYPYRRYWGMYPTPEYYPDLPYYSVLPNCTGWAEGRLRYCTNNITPSISVGNASSWIHNTSWPTSQYPTECAVACWTGGGAGHVAIVETITYDAGGNWVSCELSESSYSNRFFGHTWWHFGGVQNSTLYRNNTNRWSGYAFQGFINTPSNLIVR